MSLKIFAAALAGMFVFAASAEAKEVFTAKLEAPLAQKQKVIADGIVWQCAADTCAANVTKKASVRSCTELSKEIGRLASYGPARAPLSADDLATCNAAAPVTTASN